MAFKTPADNRLISHILFSKIFHGCWPVLKEVQALFEYLLDSYRFQRIIPDHDHHHSGSKIDLLLKLRKNRELMKKKQSFLRKTKQFSNTYTNGMNDYDLLLGDGDFDFRDAVAEFPDDDHNHNDDDDHDNDGKHDHHYHDKVDIENYEESSPLVYFHPFDAMDTMIMDTPLDVSHTNNYDDQAKKQDHDTYCDQQKNKEILLSVPYNEAIQSSILYVPSSLDTMLPRTDSSVVLSFFPLLNFNSHITMISCHLLFSHNMSHTSSSSS